MTQIIIIILSYQSTQPMPKKHSKADLRNILKVKARRLGISVAELNKRHQSDEDGEVPVLPPDNIIV
jgi:hypothetical protein